MSKVRIYILAAVAAAALDLAEPSVLRQWQ